MLSGLVFFLRKKGNYCDKFFDRTRSAINVWVIALWFSSTFISDPDISLNNAYSGTFKRSLALPAQTSPGPYSSPELTYLSGIPHEGEREIQKRQNPQQDTEPLLLPDLKTLKPTDLRLILDPETDRKSIRFSNRILNRGPGVLEMYGEFISEIDSIRVTQIFTRTDLTRLEREAGIFIFHAMHEHWHWEGFSQYQVWSLTPSGQLDKPVATNNKVGYCLEDIELFAGNQDVIHHENGDSTPLKPQFSSCYWRRQGLSVGWVDVYKSHVSGQTVDISHLPDGIYALRSTVDPANIILEANDVNNSAVVYFVIQDNLLDNLKRPPTLPRQRYITE